MDYKSFRMIANPYLLKKNIQSNSIPSMNIHLLQYLQEKYPDMNYSIMNNIVSLIDDYYLETTLKNILNDIIDSVIKFDSVPIYSS